MQFAYRVNFKHDVEVKEFHRKSYELLEPPWTLQEAESSNLLTMSFTCLLCVTVSLILPWYILGGTYYWPVIFFYQGSIQGCDTTVLVFS